MTYQGAIYLNVEVGRPRCEVGRPVRFVSVRFGSFRIVIVIVIVILIVILIVIVIVIVNVIVIGRCR